MVADREHRLDVFPASSSRWIGFRRGGLRRHGWHHQYFRLRQLQLEDPQVAELRKKQIAIADKTIAGDTLEETIAAAYARHGAFPSGANLAQLARTKGIDITEVVETGGDDVGDAVEYLQARVIKNKEAGVDVPPGLYVVKDSILIVDSEGNVSRR